MRTPRKLTPEEKEFMNTLISNLPPVIARKEVSRFLGGVVATQTLSNADSAGMGPEIAYRVGRVYLSDQIAKNTAKSITKFRTVSRVMLPLIAAELVGTKAGHGVKRLKLGMGADDPYPGNIL